MDYLSENHYFQPINRKNSCVALNNDMQYVKGKIENRKEWRKITFKPPTDFIIKLWCDNTLQPKDIKFLANLVEHDLSDIEDRYEKYLKLSPSESKSNTLDNYKLRYGDVVGLEKYLSKNKNCIINEKKLISIHGEEEGKLRFEKLCNLRKDPKQRMINKYGKEEGEIRYKNFCERNKGNWSLERQIEIHGEEEGVKRFNKIKNKLKYTHTLDSYIERHGKDRGAEIYFDKMCKLWKNNFKGYSGISQNLFEEISKKIPDQIFMFSQNGGEYKCNKYMLDFYHPINKRCIEFYGDKFHANPSIYSGEDNPHPFDSKLKSCQIWEYDNKRLDFIENCGINVHIVWEKEYKENKEECLQKCVNFLKMK